MPDIDSLADALFAAIEAGDLDAVAALYADDVIVWHNTDGIEQDRATNLRTLGWVTRHLGDRRYEQIRRHPISGGFVQQHVLRATNRAGRRVSAPVCMVINVVDDHITRIEEYVDSAHVAELAAR